MYIPLRQQQSRKFTSIIQPWNERVSARSHLTGLPMTAANPALIRNPVILNQPRNGDSDPLFTIGYRH
jgi:hypothetical protein